MPGALAAREFLGWNEPLLPRAAQRLLERHGADLGGVIVALPGRRAGRRLEELLVERCREVRPGEMLQPPEITTAGRLTDRLVQLDRPVAGRLLRTLVWADVLRQAPPHDLQRLVARRPEEDATEEWLALAETLRGLHGEVAAEDLDFRRVAQALAARQAGGEPARWRVLAELQRRYVESLAAQGLDDPHEARRAAIDAGRLADDRDVVLVGVSDAPGLLRALLRRLAAPVSALIAAPDELQDGFDEHGLLVTTAWTDASVPLDPDSWRVVDTPVDQAAETLAALARWPGEPSVDQVTIGVLDDEVVPYLERLLAEQDQPARNAAGTPADRTEVFRLVEALAVCLESRSWTSFAALVRHPRVEPLLSARLDGELLQRLDEHHAEHLPGRVDRGRRGLPQQAWEALAGLIGELAEREPRPLPGWVDPIVGWLTTVYEPVELDGEEALVRAALVALGSALQQIESLPGAVAAARPVRAATALRLLAASAAGENLHRPARCDAIELLGWLELPLDDAEVLVISGFNAGHVPESVRSHAFLPDALRRELGMVDDERRRARDVLAMNLILRSRRHVDRRVELVSGRRTASGDPLLPSPLAFHAADEALVERVRCWSGGFGRGLAPPAADPAPVERRLPLVERPAPEVLSVTDFRRYLESPYAFFLQRLLRLRGADDAALELDPARFGSLAHEVLAAFGSDESAAGTAPDRVAARLSELLDDAARRAFGRAPLAAVAVQVEQLRHRLSAFAHWQARRAAAGWRVAACEWSAELELDVDGRPVTIRGQIDRIDVRASDGAWAIYDYKTGDGADKPGKVHRPAPDGPWKDLQLPLYRHLAKPFARERGLQETPELGYIVLPREVPPKEHLLTLGWDEEQLDEALEEARRIVRCLREGRLGELGERFPDARFEPILNAIAGRGLLGTSEDEPDEEDGA
jgi:hypothetical protein